jgi:hypothetical protein
MRVQLLLAVASLGLIGCDSQSIACTSGFRSVTLIVRDSAGQLVSGATIVAQLLRTGTIIPLPQTGPPSFPGVYEILNDGHKDLLQASGDSIGVTVSPLLGSDTVVGFLFDVPGGCHIRKVAGPDTLELR